MTWHDAEAMDFVNRARLAQEAVNELLLPPESPTLYVAGPMTGIHLLNYPAFNEATLKLVTAGYHVINPARRPKKDGWGWQEFMRAALHDVADVDGVALLANWEQSKGARLEHHIATEIDLPIRSVEEWLELAA